MRLFRKCFGESKISEKAMSFHMVRSALVVVACLIALSFSAYAWFTVDVSSGTNTLIAAKFDIDVAVERVIAGDTTEPVTATGIYDLADGSYRVSLTRKQGTDAENGFCIVKVTTGSATTEYHTQQIPPMDTSLDLTLTLSQAAKVEFIPCMGTSSYYGAGANLLYLEFNELNIQAVAQEGQTTQDTEQNTEDSDQNTVDSEQTVHIVVTGESLHSIAEKYGTTVDAISELNNIADRQTIYVDQELKIPKTESEPPTEAQ